VISGVNQPSSGVNVHPDSGTFDLVERRWKALQNHKFLSPLFTVGDTPRWSGPAPRVAYVAMKRNKLMITFLSAAAFTVGCNKEGTTSQQLDKVQAKTEEAAQDMKDYSYAEKAQFVEKMQGQLAALNRDLDQLTAKIEKSSDAVKVEAKPKLQALRDQTAKLNQQLDEVKNATESTWDSVKNGFKKAYESSKDGFQQARQWVSDKIAP
jgi:cytochrome c556